MDSPAHQQHFIPSLLNMTVLYSNTAKQIRIHKCLNLIYMAKDMEGEGATEGSRQDSEQEQQWQSSGGKPMVL